MFILAACTDQLRICFTKTYHVAWVKTDCKLYCYYFLFDSPFCCITLSVVFSTKYGWTALMIAAKGGHNETVQTLIAAGADLNIQSVTVLLATFVYCYMFTQL